MTEAKKKGFTKPTGLDRDANGHRTGVKLLIRIKTPMPLESFKRWGVKQRVHVAKHRYVYRYYSSSRAVGMPNGIPVEMMKDNNTLGRYLIDRFTLQDGCEYVIHGWTGGKTATHVKVTRALFHITVQSADGYKFTITKDGALSRFWFRKKDKTRTRPE